MQPAYAVLLSSQVIKNQTKFCHLETALINLNLPDDKATLWSQQKICPGTFTVKLSL